MKNRILVACIGVPLILVILFLLPPIALTIFIAVLAAGGTYEALKAIGMNHPRIALYTMLMAAGVPFWIQFGQNMTWALTILLAYCILVFVEGFVSHFRVKMERVGGGFFFAMLISVGLSCIVSIRGMDLGKSLALLPIALPFIADAAAMFTGKYLGKHPLCPELSPKKTIEGAVGCMVGAIVTCILYGVVVHLVQDLTVNYFFLVLYGVLGGAISQIGDLAFSYVKRTRKIKDYGTILPGHGGVLDRFDSVIFCAPLLQLLMLWLPAFK